MSATNRGAKRKESDFYATPLNTVYAILEAIPELSDADFILETSAGNGNIIKALRDKGIRGLVIEAIELREEERENLVNVADVVTIGNFLEIEPMYRSYDLIIGNPPYSLAQEFVEKSLSLLAPGGRLVFLLRTAFLESKKRSKWWKDKLPTALYTLSDQPSFIGKGTDATSYSWFVWEKSENPKRIIDVI